MWEDGEKKIDHCISYTLKKKPRGLTEKIKELFYVTRFVRETQFKGKVRGEPKNVKINN